MGFDFNADEIFEVAGQIERNGAGFYRRAAKGATDSRTRKLLLDLAGMEDEHEKIFASIRADLFDQERESTVFDPDNESILFLRALADSNVFDVTSDPSEKLTGSETLEDILRTAIGLERDSIAFYLGMKEVVPERLGKARIDAIIKEEMRHVTVLRDELISLQQEE
ncbi:MAG: ferritin family protein [Deltaproteobacteria bacterium]|nr:ferritin family protein [Deltaproteobacteria bacterium]